MTNDQADHRFAAVPVTNETPNTKCETRDQRSESRGQGARGWASSRFEVQSSMSRSTAQLTTHPRTPNYSSSPPPNGALYSDILSGSTCVHARPAAGGATGFSTGTYVHTKSIPTGASLQKRVAFSRYIPGQKVECPREKQTTPAPVLRRPFGWCSHTPRL